MNPSQANVLWRQKWFPWVFGVSVACVVTAVVLIVVLVPGSKKTDESKRNDSRNTEYRYNDDPYDYNGYYDNDYDSYYDSDYEPYDGTAWDIPAEQVEAVDILEEEDYDYDYWDAVTAEDYYGAYEVDDEYENIVREFEWICDYGDPDDMISFGERFSNLTPEDFTSEQADRIQAAALRFANRME